MKLIRHIQNSSFYFHPTKLNFFVYAIDHNKDEFDLSEAFKSYSFAFLIVFHKDQISSPPTSANLFLNFLGDTLEIRQTRGIRIVWVDNVLRNMSDSPYIRIKKNKEKYEFYEYVNLNFNNSIALQSKKSEAYISFDNEKFYIICSVVEGKYHQIINNYFEQDNYNGFVIPFLPSSSLFEITTKISEYSSGSICFVANNDRNNSFSPRSAFLLAQKPIGQVQESYKAISYAYFDPISLKDSERIFSVYPTKTLENADDKFSSYLEIFPKTNIETLLVGSKGNKLLIRVEHSFLAKLNFLDPQGSSPSLRQYYFTPADGETFTLINEPEYILTGQSGTERISGNAKMKFLSTQLVKVYEDYPKNPYIVSGNSMTAILYVEGKEETTEYFVDSQKSSLFVNVPISNYDSRINKKGFLKDVLLPIVPTLAFDNKSPELLKLDHVLSKIRLSKVILESIPSNAITTQGFIKDGTLNKYQFVKESIDKIGQEDASSFDFSITGYGDDFELSLQKDEVFFVLTPELARKYRIKNKKFNVNVRFAVNNTSDESAQFVVDLKAYSQKIDIPQTHTNSIIIFKFHKSNVESLLDNVNLWTNHGNELNSEIDNIKIDFKPIVDEIKELKGKDDYLKKVFNDENWNGILLLNIPLGSRDNLPKIFTGLTSSQSTDSTPALNLVNLQTPFKFQYIAFPVNKTKIEGQLVGIQSTSFYGLINYDPFAYKKDKDYVDYDKIASYLKNGAQNGKVSDWRFILTKLLVRFKNSEISNFESFTFLLVQSLFDSKLKFDDLSLEHPTGFNPPEKTNISNLIRLDGTYQRAANKDEFAFNANLNGTICFEEGNDVLKSIKLTKIGFGYEDSNGANNKSIFRFDLNASVEAADWNHSDIISIENLNFENISLKFPFDTSTFPDISFDLSRLAVFPKISFNGMGFLRSFPIRFSHFKVFELLEVVGNNIKLISEFYSISIPNYSAPKLKPGTNFWGLIFDFDLGTLGELEALKALRGQLCIAWSKMGGLSVGIKLAASGSSSLHLNLFGAVKLDIAPIQIGKFDPTGNNSNCAGYYLFLENIKLTMFGTEFPKDGDKLNGIILADVNKGSKVAWFIGLRRTEGNKFLLGLGQRMGPKNGIDISSTRKAVKEARDMFNSVLLPTQSLPPCLPYTDISKFYKPHRNWLFVSDSIFELFGKKGENWAKYIDFQFIFNDPELYGIYIGLKKLTNKGFELDILYKKVSDSLGVWTTDFRLPDSLRNQEFGAVSVTFPNIGLDIYTNGDWKVDIGYPITSSDWSRSCLIQLFPFVGWGGFYLTKLKTVRLSVFAQYENEVKEVDIIQAGFAFRLGLGKSIQKGPFYAGASISLYGILEGAFAFNKEGSGFKRLFPDHFALKGRIGAIAEIVGYVDFRIVRASVHVILRVEFGLLLAFINGTLKPAPIYIEGSVTVSIVVQIACFRIFRHSFCIYVRFKFNTTIRFDYTLGGNNQKFIKNLKPYPIDLIEINLGYTIPIIYAPCITQSEGEEKLKGHGILVHNFLFNLIKLSKFPINNTFKANIIRPIFEELLKHTNNYSSLRNLLIHHEDSSQDTKIDFKFQPTIYVGYDIKDVNDKEHFQNTLGLNDSEYLALQEALQSNGCKSAFEDEFECPLYSIPFPTVANIKVKSKKETAIFVTGDSFDIRIVNLFNHENGSKIINHTVNAIEYTQEQINFIERHFDKIKTQFIDRVQPKILKEEVLDLRQDFAIPEYFKLLTLLLLEACNNEFLEANPELKLIAQNVIDPVYNIIEENDTWKLRISFDVLQESVVVTMDINDVLEKVIGQLNYFYNGGLRLPNSLGIIKAYTAVMEDSDLIQISKEPKDPKITLISKEGEIDLTDEIFNTEASPSGLTEFLSELNRILDITSNELQQGFASDQKIFADPYKLVEVNIPIIPGKFNIVNGTNIGSFRKIPRSFNQLNAGHSMALNKQNSLISFNVSLQNDYQMINELSPKSSLIKSISCANIQMQGKLIEVSINPQNVDTSLFELVNVNIEDLVLMQQIQKTIPKNVSIYLKVANENNEFEHTVRHLGTVTIIKTNFSTRTSPPFIINENKVQEDALEEYIANNENTLQFVKLLWEGLTTNNGGYFLKVNEKFELNGENRICEFILSAEYNQSPTTAISRVPIFCNYLQVEALPESEDEKSLVLTNVSLAIENNDIELTDVKLVEYNAVIPPHCVSIEVYRNLPSQHSIFSPLEYGVQQIKSTGYEEVITVDSVFPISPKDPEEQIISSSLSANQVYQFVTPLGLSIEEDSKYNLVGKKYKFTFGVRDIYGHRILDNVDAIADNIYLHRYFDKLIPVSSWPLIKLMTGPIKKIKIDNNELKWNFVLAIDKVAYEQVVRSEIERETILKQLNNIYAQLIDKYVVLSFYGKELNDKKSILDLIKKLIEYLVERTPSIDINPYVYNFILPLSNFKTQLNLKLEIARSNKDVLDEWFVSHEMDSSVAIIGLSQIRSILNPISLEFIESNIDNNTSSILVELNSVLNKEGFSLGIGTNYGEREIYIIRNATLEQVFKLDNSFINNNSKELFYGIRPFSLKLWSGEYNKSSYKNIDLDSCLRLILSYIDTLLNGGNILILANTPNYLEILLKCKRKLSISNGRLSEMVGNLNASIIDEPNHEKYISLFDQMISDELNNYYRNDGIVHFANQMPAILELSDHRLTISFKEDVLLANNRYNFESSKLHYSYQGKTQWTILFDFKDNNADPLKIVPHKFTLEPQITHIEHNISGPVQGIQASDWIQLVKPFSSAARFSVEFPNIVRTFPPKPVIDRHLFKYNENQREWSRNIGVWEYVLNIEDNQAFVIGDQIEIHLITKSINKQIETYSEESFEGFIAHWGAKLGNGYLNIDERYKFIKELETILDVQKSQSAKSIAQNEVHQFRIKLVEDGKGELEWKVESNSSSKLKINIIKAIDNMISMEFGGANILAEESDIYAIRPVIRAFRNTIVGNPEFHYQTEAVTSTDWITPHLIFNTLSILSKHTFEEHVFNLIKLQKLPFKTTIKYIIDIFGEEKLSDSPVLPIQQIEYEKDTMPNVDELFIEYENGFQAVSLTVYNSTEESDLPILSVHVVYKKTEL